MECKRILLDIEKIAVVVTLILIGWFSFYNAVSIEDDEMVIPDVEEVSYMVQYSEYLEETVSRTEALMNRTTSNVEKAKLQRTAKDFNRLKSVVITEGEDEVLTNVYEYGNASYVLIIIGAFLSFSFLGERKRGMWWYVHASKRGRTSLALRRLGLLMVTMTFMTIIYYIGIFVINWSILGMPDFSRSIQSFEMFGQFIPTINVGQFAVYFILLKIVFVVALSILFWAIISASTNTVIGILTYLIIVAAEFLLYTFIEPNSVMVMLRDINIFYFVDMNNLLTEYSLYSVFGIIIEKRSILILIAGILIVVVSAFTIVYNSNKKPFASRSLYEVLIQDSYIGDFFAKAPVTLVEWRKQLIWNGGLPVLAVVIAIAVLQFDLADYPYKNADTYLRQLYQECEGKNPDEINKYIQQQEKALLHLDLTNYEYKLYMENIKEFKNRYDYAVDMQKKGYDVEVYDYTGYKIYFNKVSKAEIKILEAVLLVAMSLLFANLWMCEKRFSTYYYISATKKGRKKLYKDKMLYMMVCSSIMYLALIGGRIYMHWYNYGFERLNKCIQNIEVMANKSINCSIGQYLFVTEFFRFSCCIMAALLIGHISRYMLQNGNKFVKRR